jgi:deaminated glutathione amidase
MSHQLNGAGGNELLRVAVVQMNSGDDKEANVEVALSLIDQAAGTGARLVALPEVWTYLGPDVGNHDAAEPIPGPTIERLAERARRHGIYLHCGSVSERAAGEPRLFNTTVVVGPSGEIVAKYRKIHMYDVDLAGSESYRESATNAPGDELVTFDLDGITVGLAICYDLRFPEIFRILALRGAEVIVLPAAFTMTTGKDVWEVLIRARAIENQVFIVAPNQVGAHPTGKGQAWCYGRSLIVNPLGTVQAVAYDEATVITSDLDLAYLRKIRRQVPSLANRMPDRYRWPETALVR